MLYDCLRAFGKDAVSYVVLSIADFLMTIHMLKDSTAFEVNPIANYFYQSGGIWGMLIYKFLCVSTVFGMVVWISSIQQEQQENFQRSRKILRLAVVLGSVVIVYSFCVYLFIIFS